MFTLAAGNVALGGDKGGGSTNYLHERRGLLLTLTAIIITYISGEQNPKP